MSQDRNALGALPHAQLDFAVVAEHERARQGGQRSKLIFAAQLEPGVEHLGVELRLLGGRGEALVFEPTFELRERSQRRTSERRIAEEAVRLPLTRRRLVPCRERQDVVRQARKLIVFVLGFDRPSLGPRSLVAEELMEGLEHAMRAHLGRRAADGHLGRVDAVTELAQVDPGVRSIQLVDRHRDAAHSHRLGVGPVDVDQAVGGDEIDHAPSVSQLFS